MTEFEREVLGALRTLTGQVGALEAGQVNTLAYIKSVSARQDAHERDDDAHPAAQAARTIRSAKLLNWTIQAAIGVAGIVGTYIVARGGRP